MADGVSITPGSGETIASDQIGGQQWQRIKVGIGADGVATDWDGENHLGETGGKTKITSITFTLDTSIYADGDVLADTQALAACLRRDDGTGVLSSVIFNDEDDQGQPFDVLVLDANNSLGTENSAPNISDANARALLGRFQVYSSDWYDLGGMKTAFKNNLNILVSGVAGTDDLYLALISRGTGTYTASGIRARFGILCD